MSDSTHALTRIITTLHATHDQDSIEALEHDLTRITRSPITNDPDTDIAFLDLSMHANAGTLQRARARTSALTDA